MKVAVVGGGAIGLATAFELTRAGAEVVVLERDACGDATSLGNGGWITPVLSNPIPAPGVLRKSLRWMLDPKSPLLVRPRLDPAFAAWCLRFARNCSASRYEHGARALLALNAKTLELFDRFADEGVEIEMHSNGMIMVSLSEAGLQEEWEVVKDLRRLGYPSPLELLDRDAVRALEPTLAASVVGGVYAADERHVRPETLTGGLAAWLRERKVQILEGTSVHRIGRDGSGWALDTGSDAPVRADRVVLAAGIWTKPLLRELGTRIPLQAAKGYSVTVGVNGASPRHAVMLQEAKIGCSPFAGGFRLAGTLELGGEKLGLNSRRIGAIREAAARYLDFPLGVTQLEWSGLRTLLPDGLPAIGRVPSADGVFVATGHAMLGITLAPATAAALTPLVLEDRLLPELEPFRADRSY
jgi:D-amino-acid dehydrogenase